MQSQEKNVLKKLLRCFYWQLIVLNIPRGNELSMKVWRQKTPNKFLSKLANSFYRALLCLEKKSLKSENNLDCPRHDR